MTKPTIAAPWVVQDDGSVDLLVWEGRTFRANITHAGLSDPTGYTARMWFKTSYDDADTATLAEASTVDGTISLTTAVAPATGTVIAVTIPDEDTEWGAVKSGVYDLLLQSPGGQEDTVLSGKFTVRQRVTA